MTAPLRVLANPRAGGGRHAALQRLRSLAAARGADWLEPDGPGAMREAARDAVRDGVERLGVVGGDGALHHVAKELVGRRCALGLLPLGTGNDLARALGVPTRPDQAFDLCVRGPVEPIDVGDVDGIPYLTVAGAGLHGVVAAFADRASRRLPRPLVYLASTLRAVVGFQPPRFRIEHDRGIFEERAWLACLANTRWFGGGMEVSPRSDPRDGLLELVVLRAIPRPALLALLPGVYRGSHLAHPAVVAISTRRARIETEPPQPLIGDGEPLERRATEPAIVSVRPGALRVVVGGRA